MKTKLQYIDKYEKTKKNNFELRPFLCTVKSKCLKSNDK